jgi:hypothetical protein
MTANKKIYYSVSEYRQGDYHHLNVRIAQKSDSVCSDPSYYPFWDSIVIVYQSTHNEENPVRWYAGDLQISGSSDLDKYADAIKLARRACPTGDLSDLDELLSTLDRIADYVIDDPRTSTAVTSLYPPEYKCYRDDYEAAGYSNCQCNTLARSEEEAQRSIMRKFTDRAFSNSEDFEKWIMAGKPVKEVYRYSRQDPDYRTIEERVNRVPNRECAYITQWNKRQAARVEANT